MNMDVMAKMKWKRSVQKYKVMNMHEEESQWFEYVKQHDCVYMTDNKTGITS